MQERRYESRAASCNAFSPKCGDPCRGDPIPRTSDAQVTSPGRTSSLSIARVPGGAEITGHQLFVWSA